jgi:hypothetical protein
LINGGTTINERNKVMYNRTRTAKIIQLARETNYSMPQNSFDRIEDFLIGRRNKKGYCVGDNLQAKYR